MTLEATPANALDKLERLVANIERAILGKPHEVRLVVVGLLAQGHILLEDVPGTGKTTLARALAHSLQASFRRIQFTADLLPADVLGLSVQTATGELRFQPGPIFAHIILADELNRTPPRTQSALLECMNEGAVSIEGETRPLPRPFLVVATQNPLEFEGTYPLPESQLDRFLLRLQLGYPGRDAERRVLAEQSQRDPLEDLAPVIDTNELLELIARAKAVRVDAAIREYLLEILTATRTSGRFQVGASTRAGLGLQAAARAHALMEGRDFCVPDDVKRLAVPVLAHRLGPRHDEGWSSVDPPRTEELLAELIEELPSP